MNRAILVLLVGLGLSLEAANVHDVSVANPYLEIAIRNPFALRAPPPVMKPAQPPPPVPEVFLTGITTILGNKRAFLEVVPVPKPGKNVQAKSCMLEEGQGDGDLKVLKIDAKAREVTVSNEGVVTTLTFEKNGRKPTPGQTPRPPVVFPANRFGVGMASRSGVSWARQR